MADRIDPRLEQAIIHTESSGRPSVIGDQGESIGLMQIQKETARGLYKQGLLPKEWDGKKVKKRDLPELLKDPEFNKQAGAALFIDNKNRIRKIASKQGIDLTPERLNDLAIKSHNQGVTKTIRRELLGQEPTLPRVDEYLEKVKSRIKPAPAPEAGAAISEQEAQFLSQNNAIAPTIDDKLRAQYGAAVSEQEAQYALQNGAPVTPPVSDPINVMSGAAVSEQEARRLSQNIPPSEDEMRAQYGAAMSEQEARRLSPSGATPGFADGGVPGLIDPLAPQQQPFGAQDLLVPQEPEVPIAPAPEPIQAAPTVQPEEDEEEDKEGLTGSDRSLLEDIEADEEVTESFKAVKQSPDMDIQKAYQNILGEYKAASKGRDKARKLQSMLVAVNALTQFATQYGAGGASAAGGFEVKAPKPSATVPTIDQLTTGPTSENLKGRLAVLKQLQGKNKGLTPYQKQSLDLKERSLGVRKGGQALRKRELEEVRLVGETRRREQFEHRRKEKDEISDKQTEQLIALEDGRTLGNRMKELLPKIKDDLGYYASMAAQSKRYIPYTDRDPDFVEMQQIVGTELADYIKTISGAAVSEQEALRLRKNIPTMDDTPTEFKRKLTTFMSLLDDYTANKISGFKKQGKDPSAFENQTQPAPYGETVNRNGKTYRWNASKGKYQLAK